MRYNLRAMPAHARSSAVPVNQAAQKKPVHEQSRRTFKIAAASLFLLAMVWQHVQATRLGYRVEQSRRQIDLLQGQIGSLDMQIETSLAPAQLAQRASRLGLYPAAPDCLRVLGRPLSPTDAPGFFGRLLTLRREFSRLPRT